MLSSVFVWAETPTQAVKAAPAIRPRNCFLFIVESSTVWIQRLYQGTPCPYSHDNL